MSKKTISTEDKYSSYGLDVPVVIDKFRSWNSVPDCRGLFSFSDGSDYLNVSGRFSNRRRITEE